VTKTAVVIGAGMGGLTAALRLAQSGFTVKVLEARETAGGLASGCTYDGFAFDAGPYILLDRPGLAWAFAAVGLCLDDLLELQSIDHVYSVRAPGRPTINIYADAEKTAAELEISWPGSAVKYLRFVRRTAAVEAALRPLLYRRAPGLQALLGGRRWTHAVFLRKTLATIFRESALPPAIVDALSIWTHVAGQSPERAPSPLAFVPALVHEVGCFYPKQGIRTIPVVLADAAARAGVAFQYSTKARRILSKCGVVSGVEAESGAIHGADIVVSDCGIATYLSLLEPRVARSRSRCEKLPMQSPGVCAYLACRENARPPYLRFSLPGGGEKCRLFIRPAVLGSEQRGDGWASARLLGPLDHETAQRLGISGQREYLDMLLDEQWWQDGISEMRVLSKRVPVEWGAEYSLTRDAMNPVMTAEFMRQGRMAHRSPDLRGLYLAGSATHPGQWVSFCAISGVLAADCACEDFA
jgi:phytoene dehydrogenase-like protein